MNLSSSQIKLFSIVAGVIIVFVLAFAFFARGSGIQAQNIELTVWGVGDMQADWQKTFDDFTTFIKHSEQYSKTTVKVTYRAWRTEEYEDFLLNQLAAGKGPDILYIHNTWLPKYHNKLVPLAPQLMSLDQFKDQFVPVAADDLIYDKQIFALPHYIDTLAAYYNTQQYQSGQTGSSRPASTWSAFQSQVAALTTKSNNQLARSGAALGTGKNIKYAVDLLYLLLVQKDGQLCARASCTSVSFSDNRFFRDALSEYITFSEPTSSNYTWDSKYLSGLENSNIFNDIDAFIRGKVSTVFAYASDYEQIKTMGSNFGLKFDIAEIPQTDSSASNNERIAFANYWSMAVSRNSSNADLAWELIQFATSREALAHYYSVHPRPASREDMMNTSSDNPLRVFDRQSKYARSIAVYDDNRFTQVFSDNIEQLATKSATLSAAIQKMEIDLNKVLAPYRELTP